jgi:glycosyltransferase involved in cell wall biosynthesis
MITPDAARALLRDRILINVTNLVWWPVRTGIQRVCYEFCSRWPMIEDTVPFVEIGRDRIGLIEPRFFDHLADYFEAGDPVLTALRRDAGIAVEDTHVGYYGIASTRNRIVAEVSVVDALEHCRCVLSLEESLNIDFFSLAAKTRPEKIFNLCHDFLVWTHSDLFHIDWKNADNVAVSVGNRRRYIHNFFTSTAMRDEYVKRINRGDRRSYAVIPPGADGMGRTYRGEVPETPEFLAVGTLEPRKQPLRIIEAFEKLQAQGYDARLCFAGRMGWLTAEDKERLEQAFDTYPWLRWVNAPNDALLRDLISKSRATIYISLAEGFGSPPVESLALGVPCIVSAVIPSVLDMAPNGQIRIDPADTDALSDAVRRLLDPGNVAALQDEIRTLELPTWQGFVDGIAELVRANTVAPAVDVRHRPGYLRLLQQVQAIQRIDEFDRATFLTVMLQSIEGIDEKVAESWRFRVDAEQLNSRQLLDKLIAELPEKTIDPSLVEGTLKRTLTLNISRPPEFVKEWRERLCSLLAIEDDEEFVHETFMRLLHHPPAHAKDGFAERVQAGEMSRIDLLREVMQSEEYRRRETDILSQRPGSREDLPGRFRLSQVPTWRWRFEILESLAALTGLVRALGLSSNDEFVQAIHRGWLGREPEPKEAAAMRAHLRGGGSRADVLLELLLSEPGSRRIGDLDFHIGIVKELAEATEVGADSGPGEQDLLLATNTLRAMNERDFARAGFATLLLREPSAGERALIDQLRQAHVDRKVVIAAMIRMGLKAGDLRGSNRATDWAEECLRLVEQERASIREILVAIDRLTENKGPTRDWLAYARKAQEPRADGQAAAGPLRREVGRQPRLSSAASTFVNIDHAQQLLALTGGQFVKTAYRTILDREADPGGYTYYLGRLRDGWSKESVIRQLARSTEGRTVAVKLAGLDELVAAERRNGHWLWAWVTWPQRIERKLNRLDNGRIDDLDISSDY